MTTDNSLDVETQRALVANLCAARGATPAATVLETHISWVLLRDGLAFKIKKPVDLGFLDFRTIAARRHFCERELALNGRLAPSLYLDVVAITGSVDAPVIGGDGPVLDYAVKMREFPQDALLSHLVLHGRLTAAHIDELAAEIAAFHGRIAVAPPTGPHGAPEAILEVVLGVFAKIDPWIVDPPERALLDRLLAWTRREHAARTPALRQRLHEGFVRECHGDLHLGNIALIDGVVTPFDGIEFNDSMRWIDVASEIAFTAMDLDDRGVPALAHRFLSAYLENTGDYAGLAVLRYYLVYRAMVRAMVACLRTQQMEPGADQAAMRAEYHGYLDLADRYAHRPHPAIVITHGLSGCGKSTMAQALLERIGAVRVRTDVERKRLQGIDAHDASVAPPTGAPYSDETTLATYRRVAALAREIAADGYVALVDAACLRRWQRDLLRRSAAELHVPFAIVSLHAGLATLKERIEERARLGNDPSDADVAVLEHQLRTQEPLAPDERAATIVFDAEAPLHWLLATDFWHDVAAHIGMDVNGNRGSGVW